MGHSHNNRSDYFSKITIKNTTTKTNATNDFKNDFEGF